VDESTQFLLAQLCVSAFSLASVLVAGRRRSAHRFWAWPLLVAGHGMFLCYSIVTGQWGFVPLNVGMVLAGVANWWIARHPAATATATAPSTHVCPECRYVGPTAVFTATAVRAR